VALCEEGSIRLEFSFGAFICFKTKKADVALLNQTTIWAKALLMMEFSFLPAKADSN
jgi:hypothetical protein